MPAVRSPWARHRPPIPPPAIRTWNDMPPTLWTAPLFGKLRFPILLIGISDNRGRSRVGLDLNLLISLDALLQERSVSRAAARLGLSQPTLSTALARLRRHFGDELLARTGNSYTLTPLAERLLEPTGQALTWSDRVFDTRPEFLPRDAEHEFTLVVSDAQLPIFGRVLADLVRSEAPHVRLRFEHSTARVVDRALDQLRTVDALVLPQGILSDVPSLDLYRDHWACVVSPSPGPRRPWTWVSSRPARGCCRTTPGCRPCRPCTG